MNLLYYNNGIKIHFYLKNNLKDIKEKRISIIFWEKQTTRTRYMSSRNCNLLELESTWSDIPGFGFCKGFTKFPSVDFPSLKGEFMVWSNCPESGEFLLRPFWDRTEWRIVISNLINHIYNFCWSFDWDLEISLINIKATFCLRCRRITNRVTVIGLKKMINNRDIQESR